MNHDYRPKYEQMQENHLGKSDTAGDDRMYANVGYARNVGFMLPNGDDEALNYSYLVRIKHVRSESAIYMVFTSCTVKIEGYNLRPLFLELFDHRNRFIECTDDRYKELTTTTDAVVTRVTVVEK